MSSTRIYAVKPKGSEGPPRLIRASTQAQAMRHVARDTLQCAVASQDDIVTAINAGAKVETSSDEPEPVSPQQPLTATALANRGQWPFPQ
jgi:hypothetical protein